MIKARCSIKTEPYSISPQNMGGMGQSFLTRLGKGDADRFALLGQKIGV